MAVKGHIMFERRFCTPQEAARTMGISRSQIYEMMASGIVPFEDFLGARRIPISFLEELVERTAARSIKAAESLLRPLDD